MSAGERRKIEAAPLGAAVIRGLVASAAALVLAMPAARAQQASGYMELTASHSKQESDGPSGTKTETVNDTFMQRYSFDMSWRFYPNLRFVAGGVFDRTASDTTGTLGDTGSTTQRMSPYANLLLRSGPWSAQAGYFRTRDDMETGGISTRNTQEVYNAVLGWRPDELPRVTLRLNRTNNFDKEHLNLDTTDDSAELISSYSPREEVALYYRGSVGKFEDRVEETTIQRQNQFGRVSYTNSWLDRKIQVSGEYDVSWKQTEVTSVGGGQVVTAVFASSGLSLNTLTPASATLANNSALIDGNDVASAGPDLGLPPVGGDDRPRNLGLDLSTPTDVNTLLLWVDRELPQDIANAFSWDIYTSTDNATWVLRQTVSPADTKLEIGQPPLVPSRTRFEIHFSKQTTRYIKAVTRPLDNTVPNANSFPNIFVTELAAALSVPAQEALGRTTRTIQRLNSDVRARLLAKPMLYYELSYTGRDDGVMPVSYTLSDGFSLRHAFSRAYSVSARAAREDGRDREGNRVEYIYTGSLRAVPLRTLQNSVVFTGRSTDLEGVTTRTNSVFLYNTAELYRGITANLSLGKSYVSADDGSSTQTTQVDALATLIPHSTTTINLMYDSRNVDTNAAGAQLVGRSTRSGQASVSYRPLATLYLFFSYRVEGYSGAESRFLRNYSASWTPYPGGSLQLVFRYEETFRSELQSLSRILSPRLRWNISSRWYVDAGYEKTRFESDQTVTTADAFTGTMRMWF